MIVRDYNGTGAWSRDAILQRYADYARTLGLTELHDLRPREHVEGETCWIYPVMHEIIEAIKAGDPAATQIGIEFIEQDQHFPFGKILKSNTARALRRAALTATQTERIRRRIVAMLLDGQVPHEYHAYAKLLRKMGIGHWWPEIEDRVDRSNRYVMRYYHYFSKFAVSASDGRDGRGS
jgi:hypothetical protein